MTVPGIPGGAASPRPPRPHSVTRDLAVGRLDDLGGLPACLIPDRGIRVSEGSFGGVEPLRRRAAGS
jgi:hypothetical protein